MGQNLNYDRHLQACQQLEVRRGSLRVCLFVWFSSQRDLAQYWELRCSDGGASGWARQQRHVSRALELGQSSGRSECFHGSFSLASDPGDRVLGYERTKEPTRVLNNYPPPRAREGAAEGRARCVRGAPVPR